MSKRPTKSPLSILSAPGVRISFRAGAVACMIGAAALATGCSETITKHGHQFQETDIQQIQPGMSKEQVRATLGSPTTTATVGTGHAFYYISSTESQTAFMLPSETGRQIVAVYFNEGGSVERIANYGMQDGKVFDFVSRKTPAPGGKDDGLLKQLFRNLGSKQIFGTDSY